jgi:hypothetical protein
LSNRRGRDGQLCSGLSAKASSKQKDNDQDGYRNANEPKQNKWNTTAETGAIFRRDNGFHGFYLSGELTELYFAALMPVGKNVKITSQIR